MVWQRSFGRNAGHAAALQLSGKASALSADQIRVGLFMDLGSTYKSTQAAVTLSSGQAWSVGFKAAEGPSSAFALAAGEEARFSIDGFRVKVLETKDFSAASAAYKNWRPRRTSRFCLRPRPPQDKCISYMPGLMQASRRLLQEQPARPKPRPLIWRAGSRGEGPEAFDHAVLTIRKRKRRQPQAPSRMPGLMRWSRWSRRPTAAAATRLGRGSGKRSGFGRPVKLRGGAIAAICALERRCRTSGFDHPAGCRPRATRQAFSGQRQRRQSMGFEQRLGTEGKGKIKPFLPRGDGDQRFERTAGACQ